MRLTCPNCGAEYELPDGMIPPGGKHVQCSACHTRWFMRASTPRAVSEDQILQRLEARTARPRPVLVPVPTVPVEPEEPEEEPEETVSVPMTGPDFGWEAPRAEPEPARPDLPAPEVEPEGEPEPEVEPVPAASAAPMLRSAPRLELSPGPVAPARPPMRSRFGRGLILAFLIAALAIVVYVWRDSLSRAVPPAAGALQGYGDAVDEARAWLDQLAEPGK